MTRYKYFVILDGERIRENPIGVIRRRQDGDTVLDEAFTRSLRWEPTEHFDRYRLGHNDVDHVEITEADALRFVGHLTTGLG